MPPPLQQLVRTGCLTCRPRKKKCDEQKPRCAGCTRSLLDCQWNPALTWRLPFVLSSAEISISGSERSSTGKHNSCENGTSPSRPRPSLYLENVGNSTLTVSPFDAITRLAVNPCERYPRPTGTNNYVKRFHYGSHSGTEMCPSRSNSPRHSWSGYCPQYNNAVKSLHTLHIV